MNLKLETFLLQIMSDREHDRERPRARGYTDSHEGRGSSSGHVSIFEVRTREEQELKDCSSDSLVRLIAVRVVTVARDVEVGNTRRVVATEMAAEIVTENGEVAVVAVGKVVEVAAKEVAVEDVVVRTGTHCEPVERMPRQSMEPPGRLSSCTVITSSC